MFSNKNRVLITGIITLLMVILISTLAYSAMFREESTKRPWQVWDYLGKPDRGGHYQTASVVDVGLLNPNHWPVNDWGVIWSLYEALFVQSQNYTFENWLVDWWEYTDPLTITLKLKEGIKFSDGAPLNSESIKFQMKWIKDKKNGAWSRNWLKPLKSIEIIDEYTTRWHLHSPWADFKGKLRSIPGLVISPNVLKGDLAIREAKEAQKKAQKARKKAESKGTEKAKKTAIKAEEKARKAAALAKGVVPSDKNPVSVAAWILADRVPGSWIKMKRNPNWWYGRSIGRPDMPYFDGIQITIIPDPAVRLANLKSGKIHAMGLDKSQYEQLRQKPDPDLKLEVSNLNYMTSFRFNLQKGPCKDVRVRKAISHAIDREALIVGTQFGLARIASSAYPGDHWAHNPNLQPVEYDPELSKRLLAEAGYPKGLKIRGLIGTTTGAVTLGEALKAMLAKVGVDWQADSLDAVARTDRMKNFEYDFTTGGWAGIGDPDNMASGLWHPQGGQNYGRTDDDKITALIEAGRKELVFSKRQKIYWDLEKYLYNTYNEAWLWWHISVTAVHKNVMGRDPKMSDKWSTVWSRSHPLWFKGGTP